MGVRNRPYSANRSYEAYINLRRKRTIKRKKEQAKKAHLAITHDYKCVLNSYRDLPLSMPIKQVVGLTDAKPKKPEKKTKTVVKQAPVKPKLNKSVKKWLLNMLFSRNRGNR